MRTHLNGGAGKALAEEYSFPRNIDKRVFKMIFGDVLF